jgi:hypothetical protein
MAAAPGHRERSEAISTLRSPLPLVALAMAALVSALAAPAVARDVPVSTAAGLIAAIDGALPGDVITLAAGTYVLSQNLLCDTAGTPDQSIVVRAATLGSALLRFDTVEGFKVSAPFWTFENLDIIGVCAIDSDCEHAFHLFGNADWTVLRHNVVRDFNAQLKSNGFGTPFVFPDDVLVEGNELFDTRSRNTSNPVTKLDVVGGRRWVVRANFIHDYQKAGAGSDGISYAAFLKGNSRQGLFERNLVMCERDHHGGTRLGLSFGGGGSGPPSICEDATCTPEHQGGVMRNNLILDCPADVGIYLNAAAATGIYANTLFATSGIDVRFAASVADLRDNVLSGVIRNRDGGTSTRASNLESVSLAQWDAWFADPAAADFRLENGAGLVDAGATLAAVGDDYCGARRASGPPDLGAIEYPTPAPCPTAIAGGGRDLFRDGFERGGTGAWGARSP